MNDEIWRLEEAFWLEPEGDRNLHASAVMVFPGPMRLNGAEAIRQTLKDAPRWTRVEMSGRVEVDLPGVVILAYDAVGVRAESPAYRAACTSVWRRGTDGWRICQHQQSC